MTDSTQGVGDQAVKQSDSDQPKGSSVATEDSQTVEIAGQRVPLEELKQGYMRQSDYTKKTQELAKMKKQIESIKKEVGDSRTTPDEDAVELAKQQLKALGVVTSDELDARITSLKQKEVQERKLERLIAGNPDLRRFKTAIEKLGQMEPTKAWEDIISEHGFAQRDKLLEAKTSGEVMGDIIPKEPQQEKRIADMNDEEYAEWKVQHGVKGGTSFTKKGF